MREPKKDSCRSFQKKRSHQPCAERIAGKDEKDFICSAFRGDLKGNSEKAARYCRKAYKEGCLPIAPHLIFPQFLNEDSLKERTDGISMGLELKQECDEVWVYGKTTDGMAQEVKFAVEHGIPVWFKEMQEGEMTDEAGNDCNKNNGK